MRGSVRREERQPRDRLLGTRNYSVPPQGSRFSSPEVGAPDETWGKLGGHPSDPPKGMPRLSSQVPGLRLGQTWLGLNLRLHPLNGGLGPGPQGLPSRPGSANVAGAAQAVPLGILSPFTRRDARKGTRCAFFPCLGYFGY